MPHYRLLYRVAFHLTGHAQDAEDLLQDLYLKLWQKRDDLPDEAMRDAYLVTMMRNLFVDQRRLKRLDASAELKNGDDPPDERNLNYQIDARDEVRQLEGLIRELSERDAKIIQMHVVDDRSYEEIERDTGLSQGNIRIIVMRTKKKLKEQLKRLGILSFSGLENQTAKQSYDQIIKSRRHGRTESENVGTNPHTGRFGGTTFGQD